MKPFYYFVLISCLAFSGQSQNQIEGDWTGELSFGGTSLDLNFLVYKVDDEYNAMLSVPAQSLIDYKSTSTTYADSLLTIEIKPLGIKYQGKWSTKDTIAGNFIQNGMSLKLNLTRGQIKLKRPQEPLPPYPYKVEEVMFNTAKDSLRLSGTLTLPQGEGPFPAIVLISGSGPQDRNSYIMGHKPFLLLAHELTQNGIAVLRYDERGVGRSDGDFLKTTLDDMIEDVASAHAYLEDRPEIDASKIGLLGHSMGGVIAPRLTTRKDIAYMVLLAAPGLDGDELMLKQRADFLEMRGLTPSQIETSNAMYSATYDYVTSTKATGEELEQGLKEFLESNYSEVMMEKERMAFIEQLTTNELLAIIRNQPSTYLPLVNCPVLAIGGTHDFQVSSTENLQGLKNRIEQGGNTQVEIHELEGLNHLLQESETGDMAEYGNIEQTMSPKALDLIKEWITNIAQ